MGAMPSRAQSEFYKGLLPIELADEAPTVFTADLKNDRFATGQPSASEETSRTPRALSDPVLHWCNCHLDLAVLQRRGQADHRQGQPWLPVDPGISARPPLAVLGQSYTDCRCARKGAGGGFWPKAALIRPPRRGPLTGEHRPRISEPGRWSARPSLTRSRRRRSIRRRHFGIFRQGSARLS
jgi:hypothetical protein